MTTELKGGAREPRSPDVEPLEGQLRPALDEAAVARVWRGIRAQRMAGQGAAVSSARRAGWALGGAVVLCAAAALVLVMRTPPETPRAPGALRAAVGDAALATVLRPSSAPIVLDDGSELIVAAATDMEVLANDGARFVTLIRRGRCHFSVKPGGPRRWTIETDLATVEVVGTAFTVERGERGLEVTVDHGVVLVSGEHVPGRVTRLRAGEHLVVPAVDDSASAPSAERSSAAPLPEAPVASRPSEPERVSPVAAADVAPRAPHVALVAAASPDDADARLAEADAARAAGHPEEAARVLAELMRVSSSDPRGALAAFSLAKLQLDELGRPAEAAETFAWVVRRGTPRGLVEDAQARRVEALARAGRSSEAAAEARVYEARWPDGRRLAEVRALVSE